MSRPRMTRTYLVTWQIDLSAENPVQAAEMALKIQRDPVSTATVFTVHQGMLVAEAVDPTVNEWDDKRKKVV